MNDRSALRWDLLMRYRLIEIVAQWEGRLTTNHLTNSFGIGRQQASKDIQSYLTKIAPGNLVYDKSLKGYTPSAKFVPKLTGGNADEYLHILSRNKDVVHTFTGLDLAFARTEILQLPIRPVDPKVIRSLVQAAREHRRVELGYISMTSGVEERILVPHTLVCTPQRWHVRAYCEKHREFRDFVLSRFRGNPEILDESVHDVEKDIDWNTEVTIVLAPDSRLSEVQQDILAHDFGMIDRKLHVKTRAPLVTYMLKAFNLDIDKLDADPLAQQIIILNRAEITRYLFKK
ncbi:helix-turn-helix transcriptional regulator [Undibacterium fentianense]|uniref:WYL domain-containing protein n=1 Tax=Undibacterium fentianense TaxID=2828728 RepID=A0A941E821_9BURK|nr:WYL domain-containing protein [Undibacterium fentianense]MBR7800393.1 WYL domain-containing protein [Undibacterium fentianense]